MSEYNISGPRTSMDASHATQSLFIIPTTTITLHGTLPVWQELPTTHADATSSRTAQISLRNQTGLRAGNLNPVRLTKVNWVQ